MENLVLLAIFALTTVALVGLILGRGRDASRMLQILADFFRRD